MFFQFICSIMSMDLVLSFFIPTINCFFEFIHSLFNKDINLWEFKYVYVNVLTISQSFLNSLNVDFSS
jgi:hypothetical protein